MKKLILSAAVIATLLAGCRKDPTNNTAEDATAFTSGFTDLVTAQQPQLHAITIAANTGGTIIGTNTRVQFYPNAFITANGASVTGSVQVQVKELYTKAQMVLANKTTMSPDGLLESRGETYINATQNGQQLRLRSGYSTVFFNGSSYTKPMNLYSGAQNSSDFNNVTWNLNTVIQPTNANFDCSYDSSNSTTHIDTNGNAALCDTLYSFPLDSFGWINCDYVASSGSYPASLTVQTPDGFDNTNTRIYLVFTNINTVGVLNHYAGGKFVSDAIHGTGNIPVGEQLTIVALGYKDGGWYSSFKALTLNASNTETLTFAPTTIAAYTQAVNNL